MDADAAVHLERRARCYYRYGRRVCYNSWSYYGRWILTGIVILVFLLFLFCCL